MYLCLLILILHVFTSFPGGDYKQPAVGKFKPVRHTALISVQQTADEEEIEVEIAAPGEDLPLAATAIAGISSTDNVFEATAEVVDFGIVPSYSARDQASVAQAVKDPIDAQGPREIDQLSEGSDESENWREDQNVQQTEEERAAIAAAMHHDSEKDQSIVGSEDDVGSFAESDYRGSNRASSFRSTTISSSIEYVTKASGSTFEYFSNSISGVASQLAQASTSKVKKHRVDEMDVIREAYPRMAWHDLQAAITGEAARDVASHFVQVFFVEITNKQNIEFYVAL